MKKYLWMLSDAFMIGALRVKFMSFYDCSAICMLIYLFLYNQIILKFFVEKMREAFALNFLQQKILAYLLIF